MQYNRKREEKFLSHLALRVTLIYHAGAGHNSKTRIAKIIKVFILTP